MTLDWTHGLDAWTLDAWILEDWMLEPCTLGLHTAERWDSGHLDAWTLDAWTLINSDIYSFLLLFNVKFLNISYALRPMHYGFVEHAANGFYNLNLLQLMLQFKFSSETTTRS